MFYTYILQCSDNTYYTGSTNDLEKRIKQHNSLKSGARYTKIRRPVILSYVEAYSTLSESRKREAEIKRLSKMQKKRLICSIHNKID